MNKIITREEIEIKLSSQEPINIVEVLPKKYFDEQHLPTAINVPLDQLETKIPTLFPDSNTMIIVYCSNSECNNSRIAAKKLNAMGYINTFEYVEGKQHWFAANLPTASNER